MNICENCGNEHNGEYGSGRFCSIKCSRGFSTKAKRKEINEKISKTLSIVNAKILKKKYYCDCNTIIKKGLKYCSECSSFCKYKSLFIKLDIPYESIKKSNSIAIRILKDEYFKNDLSMTMIKDKYGIQLNTLHFYLNKNGIKLKSLSKASRDAWKLGRINTIPSNTMYKHGEYVTWENKKVYLRSSYEFDYAKELDDYKIKYDVEFKKIQYYDSIKGFIRSAIPDFYLIDLNMIVEIKSSYTFDLQNMKDKFIAYEKLGYKTKLILDHKEYKI